MSGSNLICVATVLIGLGMVPATEPMTEFYLEAPAGLVKVKARVEDGRAKEITFENVPAFAFKLAAPVEVAGLGTVMVDVAFGGMIYVIADASALGLQLKKDEAADIVRIGEAIRKAAREQVPVTHPDNPGITGPTISLLSGPATRADADLKNAVVVSSDQSLGQGGHSLPGALDRSPCGTGTCAMMAVLHARGKLRLNQEFHHEGILGTKFIGSLVKETVVGGHAAVIPTITGRAWITGMATYVVDPEDPFPAGFTVGDIWPQ